MDDPRDLGDVAVLELACTVASHGYRYAVRYRYLLAVKLVQCVAEEVLRAAAGAGGACDLHSQAAHDQRLGEPLDEVLGFQFLHVIVRDGVKCHLGDHIREVVHMLQPLIVRLLPVHQRRVFADGIADAGKQLALRCGHDGVHVHKDGVGNGAFEGSARLALCSEDGHRRCQRVVGQGRGERDQRTLCHKCRKFRQIQHGSSAESDDDADVVHGNVFGQRHRRVIGCGLDQVKLRALEVRLDPLQLVFEDALQILLRNEDHLLVCHIRQDVLHHFRDAVEDAFFDDQVVG